MPALQDAIAVIFQDTSEPLHYGEITRRLLERGLWQTAGKTPQATISAVLSTDIKRHGAASRFVLAGPGVYALRAGAVSAPPPPLPEPIPEATTTSPFAAALPALASSLTFADAAEFILKQYADKSPMHYRAITRKALELGLVQTRGLTPEATLYAQVLTETKRRLRRGDPARFVLQGNGLLSLTSWITHGLAAEIDQHNNAVRKKLHAQLFSMVPGDFEALIESLLDAMGFVDVKHTPLSGDGGIDVRATLIVVDVVRIRMAVQVKRWRNNVPAPVVQQVRGSLGTHEQGLIVTTSAFSKGAIEEAARLDAVPVELMNGEQLVALLVENDIGVRRTSYPLFELSNLGVPSETVPVPRATEDSLEQS